jgi:hypothetical protein
LGRRRVMGDIEILSEMIKPTAQIKLQGSSEKPRVMLQERQCPDSSASICNLPSDAMVINVDAFSSPNDIFIGSKGECKRADYVIISSKKKCILYIELKRINDNFGQIVRQLKGAECFLKYCQEIGKSFWKDKNFLNAYKHRFISITHTSISKRPTRITNTIIHDTPENALKLAWPKDIQFNELIGWPTTSSS